MELRCLPSKVSLSKVPRSLCSFFSIELNRRELNTRPATGFPKWLWQFTFHILSAHSFLQQKVLCSLCATSFNIARVRTASEPYEASWSTVGPDLFPLGHHSLWPCSTKETGCWYYGKDELLNSGMFTDEETYQPASYTFCDWDKEQPPGKGDWIPMVPGCKAKPGRVCCHLEEIEHIAGPGCRYLAAYIGNRITAAEMQGCQTVQSLFPKPPSWKSETVDHEIEDKTDFFLTGIRDGAFQRDERLGVTPVLHNCHHIGAVAPLVDQDWKFETDGIPFHPWCFGTFLNLSRLRFDSVPLSALVSLFEDPFGPYTVAYYAACEHFE
ncbi:hypothetical protein BJX99DRAFT_128870 [Aspergillus californicus]